MSTRKPGHVTHKQLCLRIALNHGGECSHDQIVTTAAISCNSSLACHAVASRLAVALCESWLAKAGHFSCTTEDTKTTKKTNQKIRKRWNALSLARWHGPSHRLVAASRSTFITRLPRRSIEPGGSLPTDHCCQSASQCSAIMPSWTRNISNPSA